MYSAPHVSKSKIRSSAILDGCIKKIIKYQKGDLL